MFLNLFTHLLDIDKLQSLKFPTFWFENTPQGKFFLSIAIYQKIRNHFKNTGKR